MTGRPPRAGVPGARKARALPKPLELAGHLHMAAYLHAAFPGSNPRVTVRHKGVAVKWEPPHPWLQWWHTPNQGQRSVQQGGQFVRMGMRAGVPDFGLIIRLPVVLDRCDTHAPVGGGPFTFAQAAFVEAKREGGGSLSPAQVQFRDTATACGAWWAECRTVDELDAALHLWLDPWGLTWPRPRNVGLSPVVNPGSV